MCGITGYVSFSNDKISSQEFYEAHLSIAHRGPDDEGFVGFNDGEESLLKGKDSCLEYEQLPCVTESYSFESLLGHRRLSILDLSSSGHQPLVFDGIWLIYNGEIFNYVEIREELIQLGYEFRSSGDSEVFLKAYHCWGESCFSKFNGMWAAALYHQSSKKLVLTRDRFGIKPLYYHFDGKQVYFSSEVKFFRQFGLISKANKNKVAEYLRYALIDHDAETIFEGIKQLLPGCYSILENGALNIFRYWEMEEFDKQDEDSIEEALKDAIALRMRSDVPVGTLLSGGVDSSTIVGIIDKLDLSSDLNTYSAVFEESEYSEKQYIENTAKTQSINKNFVYPDPNKLSKDIDQLILSQEFPFRSLAVYSQYSIYREVDEQQKVKVLLNGQGADEIFSGYTNHFYAYYNSLLLSLRWLTLYREITALANNKHQTVFSVVKSWLKFGLKDRFSNFNKDGIFKEKFRLESKDKKYNDSLKQELWENLNRSALREYLRYEDRNSMSFSVESRLPFLDYRLVSKAFGLKNSQRINSGLAKVSLRNIAKKYVHESIINRKDKMGFVSPQEKWQRKEMLPMLEDSFADIKDNGLFPFINEKNVVKLFENYKSGAMNDWPLIWRLFCLYRWKKVWEVE